MFILVTDNNTAETKQIFRLSYKKLSEQNQLKKEPMPRMSPHVNSQDDLASQQPAAQSTQNQQVQQTPLPVQTGNNQSTPPSSQTMQQPQHTRKYS